jgi:hypothetical protein
MFVGLVGKGKRIRTGAAKRKLSAAARRAAIVKRPWLVAIVVAVMVMTVVTIALTIPISPIAVVIWLARKAPSS